MRVSLSWLEEFVDVDLPIDKLKDLLDLSGTKVEAIWRPGKEIAGVVVAYVKAIEDHPQADNLVLVDATVDGETVERVVCGAKNFSVGDKVPYAQVGARLPGGIAISERKIRGQVSRGMLCSGAELGASREASGILVLPEDAPLGADVTGVLGLDDTILELEITPNRPDCMGMIGIAREVAALLGREVRMPDADVPESAEVRSPVSVEIADPLGCPRYLARYIEAVTLRHSPSWMARRLLAVGVRPISNVVDVTNYVMFETGQPLHAFDAAKINDHRIIVRRARDGERLTTLDGVERVLHRDDLLIADPRRALAFAGVMGGEDSEVSDDTTAIILESAYFDRVSVAYTSRRHQLRTEASARFERGMDPEMVPFAAARACKLLAELAGGRVSDRVVDAYPRPVERPAIHLRPERTAAILGYEIPVESQVRYLQSLAFETQEGDGDVVVTVPTWRPDVRREEDLVEEIARLAGFDRIPSTLPPGRVGGLDPVQAAERRVRRVLAGAGLYEAQTSSFMSSSELDALGLPAEHPARRVVEIENPTSEEEPAMRTTLLPGLLRSAARNRARNIPGVALFEVGRVYEPTDEELPIEGLVLGGVFSGTRTPKSWNVPERRWEFFGAKGVLEALIESLGLERPAFSSVGRMPFHPSRGATVTVDGLTIGALGQLHPDVCAAFEVPEDTIVLEMALAPVFAALGAKQPFEELPRFPANYIDIAVVVDEDVPAAKVEEVIVRAGSPEVASVRLFDLYRGDQIEPGKKSLAYALEARDPERTLTDEDVLKVRDRIVAALAEELNASLRA